MSNVSSSSTGPFSLLSPSSSHTTLYLKELIQEYISTLTPFEQKGLTIAIDHLGPSFDMKRSSGFVRWKESREAK